MDITTAIVMAFLTLLIGYVWGSLGKEKSSK